MGWRRSLGRGCRSILSTRLELVFVSCFFSFSRSFYEVFLLAVILVCQFFFFVIMLKEDRKIVIERVESEGERRKDSKFCSVYSSSKHGGFCGESLPPCCFFWHGPFKSPTSCFLLISISHSQLIYDVHPLLPYLPMLSNGLDPRYFTCSWGDQQVIPSLPRKLFRKPSRCPQNQIRTNETPNRGRSSRNRCCKHPF